MPPERAYDVLTFDCYGTLIDWEGGIAAAFRSVGAGRDRPVTDEAILEIYASAERQLEGGLYRPYREVLAGAAARVAGHLGLKLDPGREGFLPESLPGWVPFPDTNPALERLARAGYRLGILSNVDDDLLDATCRHFTVPFELRITAQQVRSYKPAPAHFHEARERLGGRVRWLHVAQSMFHDVLPAARLGILTVWINRRRETAPAIHPGPLRQFSDLTALARWLAP
jgi:2-haloalkanoic acid dehalogenase type II